MGVNYRINGVFMMINLENVDSYHTPFEWFRIKQPLAQAVRKALITSFPNQDYTWCIKNTGDKPYKMQVLKVYDEGKINILNTIHTHQWHQFLKELVSQEYRTTLAQILDKDLSRCHTELNLWKYPNGGFLAPHLDKDDKIISQLFYFNQDWDQSWGGSLRLLQSNMMDNCVAEVFPNTGDSVILTQSNCSWHAVSKQLAPHNTVRNVVQLIFWSN